MDHRGGSRTAGLGLAALGLEEAGVLGTVPRVVVVGDGSTAGGRRPFAALLGAERELPAEAPHDDSPAVMIYTSGTTSRPKGVVLSHGALATGVRKYLVRVTLTPDDVTLIATSASQPLALRCQIMPTLWTGGRVSLLRKFTAENFVAALRRQPAKTFLALTPGSLGQLMALSEHPAVREACVIGVPDADDGEVLHAYVILQPGIAAGPEELRAFVAGRLTEFMVPAEIHVIAEMPSKGPGKVDRALLRMRAISAALVEQVPFFKNAGHDFLGDIIPRLDARAFAPGEVIVHEGNVGDEMYFLTKGQVEVVRGDPFAHDRDRRPRRLRPVSPGRPGRRRQVRSCRRSRDEA